MSMDTVDEWDLLYENDDPIPPARVLTDNIHLLPPKGRALDIACGLAENSFLLAKQGLLVDAWDNSRVAVDRVNKKSIELSISVKAQMVNVNSAIFPIEYYDVIVLTHYLEQQISESIVSSLKSGGLLYFQTYTREQVSVSGPQDSKYRLRRNELLTMFSKLSVIVYREEGKLGDVNQGFRNEAMFIGTKV